MLGIADFGAFCAAILIFLALPGPGTFALLTSTAKGGFRGGADAGDAVSARVPFFAGGHVAAIHTATTQAPINAHRSAETTQATAQPCGTVIFSARSPGIDGGVTALFSPAKD
jgi:hypothetical protein